jgi:hypothetical protein
MVHRLIRASNSAYLRLAQTAGKLQARLGHRVSLSDALDYLLYKRAGKARTFFKQMKEKRHLVGRGPERRILAKLRVKKPTSLVHTRKNQLFLAEPDYFD